MARRRGVDARGINHVRVLYAEILEASNMSQPISKCFLLIAEACAREFGTPLPKRLLELGDPNCGWHVTLNPTAEKIGDIDAFNAHVKWNGWPSGILSPYNGIFAAGEAANEDTLIEWLEQQATSGAPP